MRHGSSRLENPLLHSERSGEPLFTITQRHVSYFYLSGTTSSSHGSTGRSLATQGHSLSSSSLSKVNISFINRFYIRLPFFVIGSLGSNRCVEVSLFHDFPVHV